MNTWLTKLRTTDWDHSLWVAVYPINGDGTQATSNYISSIEDSEFKSIENFIEREAEQYNLTVSNPITIKIAPEVKKTPPKSPREGNILHIMWWSLKFRYWAYISDTFKGPAPNVRLFLIYHNPKIHKVLDHSLGLQKGLIGVVNVFANSRLSEKNNVVIVHEFLHTLGATDKYDLATNQPIFPEGYANPDQQPLFPQNKAEIMGGRVPLSETESKIPVNLGNAMIGPKTAEEIRWRT